MEKKILVIDDHEDIIAMVATLLTSEGVETISAQSGQEGLRKLYKHQPDLVILDIMMPKEDGWQVFHEIRNLTESVPVIFYSVLDSDSDIARGLNIGAVDFIPKNTSIKVFRARVKAALRDSTLDRDENPPSKIYFDGYLKIDLDKHLVQVNGKPVRLTKTEFSILSYLYHHKGFVLTSSQILNKIWDQMLEGNEASLYVYISRLRQKIERNPAEPQYILTEYGTGYRFMEPETSVTTEMSQR